MAAPGDCSCRGTGGAPKRLSGHDGLGTSNGVLASCARSKALRCGGSGWGSPLSQRESAESGVVIVTPAIFWKFAFKILLSGAAQSTKKLASVGVECEKLVLHDTIK